jgi:hypothetical protein
MTDNTMTKRNTEWQTIQWPKEIQNDRQYNDQKKYRMTDNTMTKRNTEWQTIQWPKEIQNDRQYNDQKKNDKQWFTKHYKDSQDEPK